jgi:hypothetical protein
MFNDICLKCGLCANALAGRELPFSPEELEALALELMDRARRFRACAASHRAAMSVGDWPVDRN